MMTLLKYSADIVVYQHVTPGLKNYNKPYYWHLNHEHKVEVIRGFKSSIFIIFSSWLHLSRTTNLLSAFDHYINSVRYDLSSSVLSHAFPSFHNENQIPRNIKLDPSLHAFINVYQQILSQSYIITVPGDRQQLRELQLKFDYLINMNVIVIIITI